ncbi:hypothetical protein [Propionicicella superfundia]|uniref:WXG100-like domain-containing protein n=1 Tax=Propionicicella superfundia TaxID=348582 RepID=UPI0004037407|nr:hypothetical protein [Propionicicella superfundia]
MIMVTAPACVPSWVYEGLFPQADEDGLDALAATWHGQAASCSRDAEGLDAAFRTLSGAWSGPDARAASARARNISTLLTSTAAACETLAEGCLDAAEAVRATKLAMNVVLLRLGEATFGLVSTGSADAAAQQVAAVQLRGLQFSARAILVSYEKALVDRFSALQFPADIRRTVAGMSGAAGAAAVGEGAAEFEAGSDPVDAERHAGGDLYLLDTSVDTTEITGAEEHLRMQSGPASPVAGVAGEASWLSAAAARAFDLVAVQEVAPAPTGPAAAPTSGAGVPGRMDGSADDLPGDSADPSDLASASRSGSGVTGMQPGDGRAASPWTVADGIDAAAQSRIDSLLAPPGGATGPSAPGPASPGGAIPPGQQAASTVTPGGGQEAADRGAVVGPGGTGHDAAPPSSTNSADDSAHFGGSLLGSGMAMSLTPLLGALHDLRLPIHPNRTLMQPTQFGVDDVPLAPLPIDMDIVFQKVLAPGEGDAMITGSVRTLRGFVYRRAQVAHLVAPSQLYDALGLGYTLMHAGGHRTRAFDRAMESVEVLRCNGVRQRDLVVPIARDVSRPDLLFATAVRDHVRPWLGTGGAPGATADSPIEEFEILGVTALAIPHLAEIWRLDADGSEHHVATYNARSGLWSRSNGDLSVTPGRKVDNGLYAVMQDGSGYETVTLTETHSVLVVHGLGAPEQFLPCPDGSHRLVVHNGDIAGMVGVSSLATWRGAVVQLLHRYGDSVLVDYADLPRDLAQGLGFGQIAQGHWLPQWAPFAELTDVRETERDYRVPGPLPGRGL